MKDQYQLFNKSNSKKFRRRLRKNLTPAEATLWRYLKNKQLDERRFRRQFSVENYTLDFYCPAEKIAIELDGDYHFSEEGMIHDAARDQFLIGFGIKVIRFENEEIFANIEDVLERIRNSFKMKL